MQKAGANWFSPFSYVVSSVAFFLPSPQSPLLPLSFEPPSIWYLFSVMSDLFSIVPDSIAIVRVHRAKASPNSQNLTIISIIHIIQRKNHYLSKNESFTSESLESQLQSSFPSFLSDHIIFNTESSHLTPRLMPLCLYFLLAKHALSQLDSYKRASGWMAYSPRLTKVIQNIHGKNTELANIWRYLPLFRWILNEVRRIYTQTGHVNLAWLS